MLIDRGIFARLGQKIIQQHNIGFAFANGRINVLAVRRPGNSPRNERGLPTEIGDSAHRSARRALELAAQDREEVVRVEAAKALALVRP